LFFLLIVLVLALVLVVLFSVDCYTPPRVKDIIEDYYETVMKALDFVCDSPIADDEIPTDAKLAFFNETRHAYGRTALMYVGYDCLPVCRLH
jgi:hypothetical protein